MFLKSLLSIALFSLFALNSVYAKIWTVAPRPGANFTTLSGAVGSASVLAGDTILVSGSTTPYAGFTINKRLTVIGPGYFLGENTGLQSDTNDAEINSTVTVSAPGTVIMGLFFQRSLFINANNVTIERCRMEVPAGVPNENPLYIYTNDSVIVRQCYIKQNANSFSAVTVQGNSTQIFIQNNYIEYAGTGNHAITVITSAITGNISNNTISGNVGNVGGGFTFNNNILRSGTFSPTANITYNNNIGNSTQFGILNGNQQNVSMSSVFVVSGTSDSKWQALITGPAHNAGLDGTDCGMFGGASPYRLSGAPSIPLVYSINGSIDGTLLYMNVKVKSNN